MNTITIIDGPAGSEKTYAVANEAGSVAHNVGIKTQIISPTNVLSHATNGIAKELHPLAICKSIDGVGSVKGINEHYKQAAKGVGEVLNSSQASFLLNDYIESPEQWNVDCDEIISVLQDKSLQLITHYDILSDLVILKPITGKNYSYVEINDNRRAEAERRHKNIEGDLANAIIFEILTYLLNSYKYNVYTITSEWNSITAGGKKGEMLSNKLPLYIYIKPTIFDPKLNRVRIIGAYVSESLLVRLWEKDKQNPVTFIKGKLDDKYKRVIQPPRDYRKTINYYAEDGTASKYRMDKVVNGKTILRHMEEQINLIQGGDKILVTTNVRGQKCTLANAESITTGTRGSNVYMTYDDFAHFAVTRPSNEFIKFAQEVFSIKRSQMINEYHNELAYQAAMRSSNRNWKDDGKPRRNYFPNSDTCKFVTKRMPGAVMEQLPLPIAKRVLTKGAERVRAFRERQKGQK